MFTFGLFTAPGGAAITILPTVDGHFLVCNANQIRMPARIKAIAAKTVRIAIKPLLGGLSSLGLIRCV